MQEFMPERRETDIRQHLLNQLVELVEEHTDQFEHDGKRYGFRTIEGKPNDPDRPAENLIILTSYINQGNGNWLSPVASIDYYQPVAPGFGFLQEYLIDSDAQGYRLAVNYFSLDAKDGPKVLPSRELVKPSLDDIRWIIGSIEVSNARAVGAISC